MYRTALSVILCLVYVSYVPSAWAQFEIDMTYEEIYSITSDPVRFRDLRVNDRFIVNFEHLCHDDRQLKIFGGSVVSDEPNKYTFSFEGILLPGGKVSLELIEPTEEEFSFSDVENLVQRIVFPVDYFFYRPASCQERTTRSPLEEVPLLSVASIDGYATLSSLVRYLLERYEHLR